MTDNCTDTKAAITVKAVFDGTQSGQQAFMKLIRGSTVSVYSSPALSSISSYLFSNPPTTDGSGSSYPRQFPLVVYICACTRAPLLLSRYLSNTLSLWRTISRFSFLSFSIRLSFLACSFWHSR